MKTSLSASKALSKLLSHFSEYSDREVARRGSIWPSRGAVACFARCVQQSSRAYLKGLLLVHLSSESTGGWVAKAACLTRGFSLLIRLLHANVKIVPRPSCWIESVDRREDSVSLMCERRPVWVNFRASLLSEQRPVISYAAKVCSYLLTSEASSLHSGV